jgi:heme A synthase
VVLVLIGIVLVQLVWGALVRHNPTPLTQRLHLITAFAVVAAAVWTIRTARSSATAWERLRRPCIILSTFLVLQILLGVEAWMGKFTSGVLPELQKITKELAIIRISHVLIGTGILATSFTLLALTRRAETIVPSTENPSLRNFADETALASR